MVKTATKKAPDAPATTATKTRAVLVCTEFRGVFFGYTDAPLDATTLTLSKMRNCLYWHQSIGGVLGLAQVGPNDKCTIGALVDGPMGVQKVTCIVECTEAAAKAWESAKAVS